MLDSRNHSRLGHRLSRGIREEGKARAWPAVHPLAWKRSLEVVQVSEHDVGRARRRGEPGEQVQPCERATPSAAVSVLDAGRNHLAMGVPRFVPDAATVTSTFTDWALANSTSRVSHQQPTMMAARGLTGPSRTQGSLHHGRAPSAAKSNGRAFLGPPFPRSQDRVKSLRALWRTGGQEKPWRSASTLYVAR